jgi:hypothetical protein
MFRLKKASRTTPNTPYNVFLEFFSRARTMKILLDPGLLYAAPTGLASGSVAESFRRVTLWRTLFLCGVRRAGRESQNLCLTHFEFPPFAKDAKDGAPILAFSRQFRGRIYFCADHSCWSAKSKSPRLRQWRKLLLVPAALRAGMGVLRRAENALLRMTAFCLSGRYP